MNTTMHVARFTVAYWCVLIAALLPLACSWLAKSGNWGKPRKDGGFDNHDPRAWMARQTDWRARANAAQANSFETLPFFIGAVIIAHLLGAGQTLLDILAFLYVMLRVFYILMYVSDMP
ncbi:MAG: glutathione metabolism protein, partial [Acidovorax sp.]